VADKKCLVAGLQEAESLNNYMDSKEGTQKTVLKQPINILAG